MTKLITTKRFVFIMSKLLKISFIFVLHCVWLLPNYNVLWIKWSCELLLKVRTGKNKNIVVFLLLWLLYCTIFPYTLYLYAKTHFPRENCHFRRIQPCEWLLNFIFIWAAYIIIWWCNFRVTFSGKRFINSHRSLVLWQRHFKHCKRYNNVST